MRREMRVGLHICSRYFNGNSAAERMFMKYYFEEFLVTFIDTFQFWLKLDNNDRRFTLVPARIFSVTRRMIIERKNVP
jgi:hypothetical protein